MPRGLVIVVLCLASSSFAAEPARQVVVIMPPASDGDGQALGLVLQGRANRLLVATGRYHDVHAKMILRVAEREGLGAGALAKPEAAALIARRLGSDRVVHGKLARQRDGWLLEAAALRNGKPEPGVAAISVKLSSAELPEAIETGALALARLAAAPDKVQVAPASRPLTRSAPALLAYARCYAALIEQPIGIDTPVVIEEKPLRQAIDDCKAALAADPQLGEAQAALGLALALAGQDAEAVQALAQVHENDEYLPLYWLGRYWLVTRYQSSSAGATALKTAIERHPYFLLAHGYLAEHDNAIHEDAAALDAWRAYQAEVPHSAFIRGRISHSLARLGRNDEALVEARAALAEDPDNREARLELASREVDAGQYAEAVTMLEPLAQRPGARPEVFLRLGYSYLRQGNVTAAMKWLGQAESVAQRPAEWRTRARARLDRGLLLVKTGRVAEGQQLLVSAAEGGLRPYIAAQKDEELKQAVRDAELAQKGRHIKEYQFQVPREASPFWLDGAGEISPSSPRPVAPKMFEVLRF